MAIDARSAPVKTGDYVIWTDNRGTSRFGMYQVLDVKTRVKIKVYEAENGNDGGTWVNPQSVIVVDSVPYVGGRLNTKEKEKDERPEDRPHPRLARKR